MGIESELRTALTTTTNVTSGYDATYGVEIEKKVQKMIIDILNNQTPLRNMIPRESMNGQLSYIWNIRTANNDSSAFYSEGGDGTAATGTKVALIAVAKSFRTDWEVTGLMQAGSASYYNAMADEIRNAATEHGNIEEKQIVDGTDSSAYGDASGFLGLKQLVDSYTNSVASNTDTVYGITRTSGKTYLDCGLVAGGDDALSLPDLDSAVSTLEIAGGQPGFFLCSPKRRDQIAQLLQAQQRFVDKVEVAGGFRVMSYLGIPILTSRYMDKAGESDTDTVLYLVGKNNARMKVLKETENVRVANTRSDVEGGYLKTYEVLVVPDLTKNIRIHEVTAVS